MDSKPLLAIALAVVMLFSATPLIAADAEEDVGFPERFDQRDLGIVTPVKDQSSFGTCWAFGGIGAAETAILSMLGTTYEEMRLDLSERHAAYFANTPIPDNPDDPQAGEGIHWFSEEVNAPFIYGGMHYNFSQLFASGIGPVPEESFPYHGKDSLDMLSLYQDQRTADIEIARLLFNTTEGTLEELLEENEDNRESIFANMLSLGAKLPEGVDGHNFTAEDMRVAMTERGIRIYSESNLYSKYDDWSIPDEDRYYTWGFTMLDGNLMKDVCIRENGKWTGVDWEVVEDVKSELMAGHGLVIAYCQDNEGYNGETGTVYQGRDKGANHMVQLIGWDDSYSSENFMYSSNGVVLTPPGDGAWLCKNSWGSQDVGTVVNGVTYYHDFGIRNEEGKSTGYFWLSFYDKTVGYIESLSFTDSISGDEGILPYCYDFTPDAQNSSWEYTDVVKTANVFEAAGRTHLNAVSVKTYGYDSEVRIKVYRDLMGDAPDSGELVFEKECSIPYKGIHMIHLDEPIWVREGHTFSVVAEEQSQEGKYIMGASNVASEEYSREHSEVNYTVTVVNEGESFVYMDGTWTDWFYADDKFIAEEPESVFDNFGIKAFSIYSEKPQANHLYDGLIILILLGIMGGCLFRRRMA